MTPLGYLRMLARHWLALGLPVGCGLALCAGYLATTPSRWTATSQVLFAVPSPRNDPLQLIGGQRFVQSRMPTYAALVTSPLVTGAAVRDAHLPFTAGQLTERISVEQPQPTTLLNISVTDDDPHRAKDAADALAAAVGSAVRALDSRKTDGQSPVSVRRTRPAQLPSRPGWPQPWPLLAAGGLLGLLAGLLAAAGRHTRDAAVRGRAGVLRASGQEPLAVVPATNVPAGRCTGSRIRARATPGRRPWVCCGPPCSTGGWPVPDRCSRSPRPRPGDGRTTVAVDLAHALALTGADVVLVDAELRRPGVARLLRLGYRPGLANVLLGQFAPDDVLVPSRTRTFSVLPAGWSAQDTARLLASPAMAGVLAGLRQNGSCVVLDTPAAASAEVIELLALADAVLVVVRHDSTPGQAVAELMRRLRGVRARVAGVVLTAGPADGTGGRPDGGAGDGPRRDATPPRPARTAATDR